MMKYCFPAQFCLILISFFLLSCDGQRTEKVATPQPEVFTPQVTDSAQSASDIPSDPETEETETIPEPAEPEVKQKPMPTVAELKKITLSQEAKRELSNDAMQVYRMKPGAFFAFLKSRIPYYKGKGNLKAENDLVRIEITEKEMLIETPKGRQTFSME